MQAPKRRTRSVIFRLTEDEYNVLKAAHVAKGARNLSDFARTELLRSVALEREEVTARLAGIESGMQRLESLMARVFDAR